MTAPLRLHRLPDVITMTGLSRMTIEREMQAGRFPRPVYPTPATRAWRSDELEAWIKGLPREAGQERQPMAAGASA